jgi:demethoxyubiquinone hydroxylase (CLK1/Coq7/Cat5 family)
MNPFISFIDPFKLILSAIVSSEELHAKWLNTLSYLENCGARKIAACEHPTYVKEEMLKHAAEEFRHAHYLKRQIKRVTSRPLNTYSLPYLLGGSHSVHYLMVLDLQISRYLAKDQGLSKKAVKEAAYLLVTYAIELRAGELYPIYDTILREINSKVTVKSILLEEKEHLNEMKEGLKKLQSGFLYAEQACKMEATLCQNWLHALQLELF